MENYFEAEYESKTTDTLYSLTTAQDQTGKWKMVLLIKSNRYPEEVVATYSIEALESGEYSRPLSAIIDRKREAK